MIAFDTDVIVAGLLPWHPHHAAAFSVLDATLNDAADVIIPVPALFQAWSVMTRLPPPHRIGPHEAGELLSRTFRSRCRLVGLDQPATWDTFDRLVLNQWIGGIAHDVHVLACAHLAGATRLYTFNRRDFERLSASFGVEIVDPRSSFN